MLSHKTTPITEVTIRENSQNRGTMWEHYINAGFRVYKRTPYRTFYFSTLVHPSEEKTLQKIYDCLQISTQILDARLTLTHVPALVTFTLLGQEGSVLNELIERIKFTFNN